MKSIMFLVPYLFLGGAETQFRNLIKGLAKKNYQITVFVLLKEEKNFLENFDNVQIKFIGFKFNKKYKNNFLKLVSYLFNYLYVSLFFLFHFLFNKYDLVISYSMILTPFIPILKLFNKKLIYSVRTASDKLYNRKYLSFLYNIADIITCNSPTTEEILKDLGVNNVKTILNGVNFNDKSNVSIKKNKNIEDIYIIARIHPIKNQLVALKALKAMKNRKIFLVGSVTDTKYYNQLLEYINKNNLKDRVFFEGFVKNISEVYRKADLIILPSYEEGLPNVILESFLYKRYCIASNISANKFILSGRGGLFNPDNYKELVEEIINFENKTKNEKKNILLENHYFLKNKFSIKRLVNEYESLFKEDEL
ncbi:glycosyltransferase [Halanaerobium praevalens]|uniref:Glycosyl transferase group 1 n=1 Tax=Halanaerobium praevalens (strain ATCC 33744 / DSM 2228 / GSL) TaxID=572479 RepID=E3DNF7_HALPG|nr:glycosyltransferase [Halanaerobium praevalens]ADO76495.1 glycosyl transferase group 1 [Halanaerobium praevalens DSM 2228]